MYVTSFNVPSIWTRRAFLSHLTEKIKAWRSKGAYPWSCTSHQGSWNGLLGKIKVSLSSSNPDICFHFPKGVVYRYNAWLCNSHCYHSSFWNFLMPRLRISHWLIRGLSARTFFLCYSVNVAIPPLGLLFLFSSYFHSILHKHWC